MTTVSREKQVMLSQKTDKNISNSLEDTIKLYKSIGDRNADFLFNWIYNIYNEIFLPSIDSVYKEKLTLTKTKLGIYDVLIDDLADNAKLRNGKLLEQCMEIPWNNSSSNNNQYVDVCRKIWYDCINQIQKFPRYDEFKDIFYFDLHQFMNCNRYSYLVNTKGISNFTEDKNNLQHGVMVLTHCNLDLMCSPDFNYKELEKAVKLVENYLDKHETKHIPENKIIIKLVKDAGIKGVPVTNIIRRLTREGYTW